MDLRRHLWDGEGTANGETWAEWWQSARAEPAFERLLQRRDEVLAELAQPEAGVTLPILTNALTAAGFAEIASLQQTADHHVIAAIR